jgi:hypothetical protein
LARARREEVSPEVISWGEQIVTISVLSILFCAPIGSLLIMNLGPLLLDNTMPGEEEEGSDNSRLQLETRVINIVEEDSQQNNQLKQH